MGKKVKQVRNRRRVIKVLTCLVILAIIFYAYMRFEYRNIKVTSVELDSQALQDIKIVFAADFQYDMNRASTKSMEVDAFQAAIDKINEQKADLILLGGDYQTFTSNTRDVVPYLSQLTAPKGVYAVFGNHDRGVENTLEEALPNIRFLRNETVKLSFQGGILELCGVEDLWFGKPVVDTAAFEDSADYRILISHNPDFFEELETKTAATFDLMLAGHLHGGQVTFFGLCGFPPVINHATAYGERYRYGEKKYDGNRSYVSSGLGGSVFNYPLRFGARPEVVVIE